MRTRSGIVALVAVGAVAAVAVILAVIAFGDGGTSSREDYQVAVVNARDRADFALARMGRSSSVDELTTRLDEAADVLDDTAGDLDAIGAPDEYEAANVKLVRALRALSGEVAGTAETIRDPAFADVLPTINSLSFPQWNAVNRALQELADEGVPVRQLERH